MVNVNGRMGILTDKPFLSQNILGQPGEEAGVSTGIMLTCALDIDIYMTKLYGYDRMTMV